jgi:hypothetical protein
MGESVQQASQAESHSESKLTENSWLFWYFFAYSDEQTCNDRVFSWLTLNDTLAISILNPQSPRMYGQVHLLSSPWFFVVMYHRILNLSLSVAVMSQAVRFDHILLQSLIRVENLYRLVLLARQEVSTVRTCISGTHHRLYISSKRSHEG